MQHYLCYFAVLTESVIYSSASKVLNDHYEIISSVMSLHQITFISANRMTRVSVSWEDFLYVYMIDKFSTKFENNPTSIQKNSQDTTTPFRKYSILPFPIHVVFIEQFLLSMLMLRNGHVESIFSVKIILLFQLTNGRSLKNLFF